MKTILEVRDLKACYKTPFGSIRAVDGVSFELKEGEVLGIIGESGSGKSTLAQSIVLPKPPLYVTGGSVLLNVDGSSLDLVRLDSSNRKHILGSKISLIPQYVMDALPTVRKIKHLLKDLAREKGYSYEELKNLFVKRLREVNLSESIVERYPLELSGGMKQRTIIVLATLFNPSVLIADEPTSALDVVSQRQVLELLLQLRDTGTVKSIIYITHDIATVRQIADKVMVMYAGKVVEIGGLEDVISQPLHPYTKALIGSVPELRVSHYERRLEGLKGSPPNLRNPPEGCRFRTRCPYAVARCTEDPPSIRVGEDRIVNCWLYYQG